MNVTRSHTNEAQEIANAMALMGIQYDIEEMSKSVAIIEWAKSNDDFRSKSGRSYMNVAPTDIYGKSKEDAVEFIVNKVAKKKQHAGAQALKEKYGDRAARRIIAKHAV